MHKSLGLIPRQQKHFHHNLTSPWCRNSGVAMRQWQDAVDSCTISAAAESPLPVSTRARASGPDEQAFVPPTNPETPHFIHCKAAGASSPTPGAVSPKLNWLLLLLCHTLGHARRLKMASSRHAVILGSKRLSAGSTSVSTSVDVVRVSQTESAAPVYSLQDGRALSPATRALLSMLQGPHATDCGKNLYAHCLLMHSLLAKREISPCVFLVPWICYSICWHHTESRVVGGTLCVH